MKSVISEIEFKLEHCNCTRKILREKYNSSGHINGNEKEKGKKKFCRSNRLIQIMFFKHIPSNHFYFHSKLLTYFLFLDILSTETTCSNDAYLRGSGQKVVAYSFYGDINTPKSKKKGIVTIHLMANQWFYLFKVLIMLLIIVLISLKDTLKELSET